MKQGILSYLTLIIFLILGSYVHSSRITSLKLPTSPSYQKRNENKKISTSTSTTDVIAAAASTTDIYTPSSQSFLHNNKHVRDIVKKLGPILVSSFCVAAIIYPLDLVRALQMANAGSAVKKTTQQLLVDFKNTHGIQGTYLYLLQLILIFIYLSTNT